MRELSPFIISGASDIGFARKCNEDFFAVAHSKCGTAALAVVCDGIGGNPKGELASRISCQMLAASFMEQSGFSRPGKAADFLLDNGSEINRRLLEKSRKTGLLRPMCCTMVAAVFTSRKITVLSTGDSRLYCFGRDDTRILTRDQVVQLASGESAICRAMGLDWEFEPELLEFDHESGSRYLLATDGMYRSLTVRRMQELLGQNKPPQVMADFLVRTALFEGGGFDNITAVFAAERNWENR